MTKKREEQDHDVKYWFGMPYRWKWKNLFLDLWNEREARVFPPKQFGVGWGLNFHALMKKINRKN